MVAELISLLTFYGLALNFGAAAMFGMPILFHPRISLDDQKIGRDLVLGSAGGGIAGGETARAIIDFNKKMWKAVEEQRRYTGIGLVMLSIGIAMQIAG